MPMITSLSLFLTQLHKSIKNTCISSATQHSLNRLARQIPGSPALPSFPSFLASDLSTRAPDTLQKSISLGQSVQCIVALTHATYKPTKCERVVLARVPAILVNLCD